MDPNRIKILREQLRSLWEKAEEHYEPIRPTIPGSPPLWVVVAILGGSFTVLFWWMVLGWLLGGGGFWWRLTHFLSEATRVYEPTP